MFTEFFFLQAHKWIDWSLFTASHGWKWRPYYQVPRVWSYSYGNQGLHVENVYDPFANTAYQTGPLYQTMEWLVDAVGQGPNPQWVRDRQRMQRALAKADKILHYRFSPQMQVRSLKKERYYLKQFSLSLHAQYIYKYFPVLLTDFFQFKVLPPLVQHAPEIFISIESSLRRLDYHFANKSIGYHLFIDLLEQLNPPLDDEDRVIPYDYIAESGQRMIQQYKDYVYLDEMLTDIQHEVSKYGKLYDDFVKLAKEEKYHRMAKGDPFISRFEIPSIDGYCQQFHNYDLTSKSKILIDLKRVTSDYRAHFGPFDLIMASIHRFLLRHSTPEIYGQYWAQRQIIHTNQEYINAQEAEAANSPGGAGKVNDLNNAHKNSTRYNPLNTLYKDSRLPGELSMKQKLEQLKHEFNLTQDEKIFNLDRSNVKYIRTLYKDRDAPLHSPEQLPHELATLHANIIDEMMTVLPTSIHDEKFVKPLFEEYYNNRVNQYVYKYYPSTLEPEIKEELDLRYDKSSTEQYFDYIHERVEHRKNLKEKRIEILTPYKAIKKMKNEYMNKHYTMDPQEFEYRELLLQDQPYDAPFYNYPGNPQLNTDDPTIRHKYLQQYGYRKMINDIKHVEDIERQKALKITHGYQSIQRKDQLHGARKQWTPLKRIHDGLPPFTSTKFQNMGQNGGSNYSPELFSQNDIRSFTRIYPGVSFDQVLQVLDDSDKYLPPIKQPISHNNSPPEKKTHDDINNKYGIMDWVGLPRRMFGNDNRRNFYTLQQRDEVERFRQDNHALYELYSNHFHTTDDNPLEIKHRYVLSPDAQYLKEQHHIQ